MPRPTAAERRAAILDAAYRIFAAHGYHETNVADIARELGIGHGTFYRYFENKLDIFSNVIDVAVDRILAVVATEDPYATATLDEYQQQVMRIGAKLFDLFMTDPLLSQIIFVEAIGIDERLSRKLEETFDRAAEFTEKYFDNGVQKGFLRADFDRRTAAYALNAMIFEAVRQMLRANDPAAEQQRWTETVFTYMFRGLAP